MLLIAAFIQLSLLSSVPPPIASGRSFSSIVSPTSIVPSSFALPVRVPEEDPPAAPLEPWPTEEPPETSFSRSTLNGVSVLRSIDSRSSYVISFGSMSSMEMPSRMSCGRSSNMTSFISGGSKSFVFCGSSSFVSSPALQTVAFCAAASSDFMGLCPIDPLIECCGWN
uniref:Putative secreted protein n=1 Tax=Anopheles marajoara TaxID=58244 RepID=A0A2M4C6H9_9DIPT